MSEEQRKEAGMTVPIPSNLGDALVALEKDSEWAKKTLGENFVKFYLMVKKYEMEAESKKDETERKMAMVQIF